MDVEAGERMQQYSKFVNVYIDITHTTEDKQKPTE